MLDRRARSAGVSRNWSVLYVSYLEVTLAEGVYKLYVVYRRQEEVRDSRCGCEVEGRWATASQLRRKLLLLPSVYPCDSAANQRISSSGSLDGCPSVRPKRKPSVSVGFPTRAREESANAAPDESPAFIRDARGIP